MLTPSTPSVSDALDLNQAIARLSTSPHIDGIASFGSRAANQTDSVSDYDLLLLVNDLPVRIFQMVTTIGGLVADIVPGRNPRRGRTTACRHSTCAAFI